MPSAHFKSGVQTALDLEVDTDLFSNGRGKSWGYVDTVFRAFTDWYYGGLQSCSVVLQLNIIPAAEMTTFTNVGLSKQCLIESLSLSL